MRRSHRSRKSSHSHHRRSRRRHVGAIDVKKVGMKVVGIAAGAFLAKTINNMVIKASPTLSPKLVALIDIGGGLMVPKFLKSELGSAVGDGMIAIGALSLAQDFGIITGVGALPKRIPSRVIGAGGQPFLTKMVGASGRNYLKQTVGGNGAAIGSAYGIMESMNRSAMGAAGRSLGALAIEE